MIESEKDLVVIGGGPAGLLSAISASKNKVDVTLLESKEVIGLHEHCAGLLSIDGLKSLDLLNLPSDVIQNSEIRGSRLYSPTGKLLVVQKSRPTAWVVNRARFDAYLASLATDLGVDIRTSSRVKQITRQKESLKYHLGKKSSSSMLSSKLTILAEGRFPSLNEQIGLPKPSRKDVIFASQFIMSGVRDIDTELVEIYQYNSLVPGFFAWIIPINDSTAKVGLGTTIPPAGRKLDDIIRKHPIAKKKLSSAKIEKRMSGAIPIGSHIKKTFTDNALVVGDAAGQTKPTTGGGVIFGGLAAKIAGEVVGKALEKNDFSSRFLSQYERKWKKEFGFNLKIMKIVRNYLNSLNDDYVEKLFTKLNKPKIKEKISKFGDVDEQAKIVFRLLSNLSLWPFVIGTGMRFLFKKN
ncbi:MAG: NAD(P)/FAD-dependent oxidoreductase [Candidatus Heimdallarchaeota archaeon]|nr:NAD(P)/FAD-dependent oxidoreductase [Candidatus Heimdallarchaeota archaeon]